MGRKGMVILYCVWSMFRLHLNPVAWSCVWCRKCFIVLMYCITVKVMEPVRWPALSPPEAGPSAKSPREDRPPASPNSPTFEREKSATPTNEHPSSPEPNCAICLGKSQNKSFTDSCLHQFCFNCLLEWSKVRLTAHYCHETISELIM